MRMLLQDKHRNRRHSTVTRTGGPPGSSGPRIWRSRNPWPRMPSLPPTGRLGASHTGQWVGRTRSTAGKPAIQDLISISAWMILHGLWSSVFNALRSKTRGVSVRQTRCPLVTFLSGQPHAVAPLEDANVSRSVIVHQRATKQPNRSQLVTIPERWPHLHDAHPHSDVDIPIT